MMTKQSAFYLVVALLFMTLFWAFPSWSTAFLFAFFFGVGLSNQITDRLSGRGWRD